MWWSIIKMKFHPTDPRLWSQHLHCLEHSRKATFGVPSCSNCVLRWKHHNSRSPLVVKKIANIRLPTAMNRLGFESDKQIEINSTYTESIRLVELINLFFDLLNETQQIITIQSSGDTLILVENAIEEVSQLETLLITVNNLAETARVDSRSANQTINVMASKVDRLKQDLTDIETQIVEVESVSETLNQHEVEGEEELNETETTIDSVNRYIEYFRSRVELLEEEFQMLNQSLIGIGIVSEEEIDSILKKLGLLEAEALTNYERLDYTERDLLEEKRELEYLERAVYESYQQIGEFDSLLDDLKEYNDQHSCNQ
ncbi:hypothetical protein LOD99_11887 [Oopsacas minuta]|uniref:Uncharacterized protein n=1 Tax=Oopsacas minuta TaxID=111878 RepID=A0AAV7JGZ7_9METZ|nr:hypothetical protein LOD99_11887 [Oopsacas minuta]